MPPIFSMQPTLTKLCENPQSRPIFFFVEPEHSYYTGVVVRASRSSSKACWHSSVHGQPRSSLFPKMLFRFQPFPGRAKDKKSYGSLRLFKIFKIKNVLQIIVEMLRFYKKKVWTWLGIFAQLSQMLVAWKKLVEWKNVKISTISGTMHWLASIFQ